MRNKTPDFAPKRPQNGAPAGSHPIILKTKQRMLLGPEIDAISALSERMRLRLAIPTVVIQEATNLFREEYARRLSTLKKNWSDLGRFSSIGECPRFADEKEEMKSYESSLRSRIEDLNMRVLPYPEVSHEEIVGRCLRRRKPFNSTDKGYRDALIWESVLTLLAEEKLERVLLVTMNRSDFSGRGNSLHDDLRADLIERGFEADSVVLCESLKVAFESHLVPRVQRSEQLVSELESTGRLSESLYSLCDDHETIVNECSMFPLDDLFLSELLEVRVSGARLLDLDRNAMKECPMRIQTINDHSVFLRMELGVLGQIECLADEADAMQLVRKDKIEAVRIDDPNWSGAYVLLQVLIEFFVELGCYIDFNNPEKQSRSVCGFGPVRRFS